MIITCGNCHTRYKVDENLIKVPKFRARCQKCSHSFLVTHPTLAKGSQAVAEPAAMVTETEQAAPIATTAGRNCRVISVCNQKGGVAKTTTCMNLGASLAMMGKKVLLIDFDIQANLTMLLGFKDAKSFFEVIHGTDGGSLADYVIKTKHDFWLLPSNSKMALLSKKHLQNENFSTMLRDKIAGIRHHFDYILIDTPPSGDFYTLNALLASDMAAIPTQCEYLSMNGVNHIRNMINVIGEKSSHVIDYRVLITLYEESNTVCKVVLNKLKEQFPGKLFNTVIEKDGKIQESQIIHTPAYHYSKESLAALQYQHLAKEIDDMYLSVTAGLNAKVG